MRLLLATVLLALPTLALAQMGKEDCETVAMIASAQTLWLGTVRKGAEKSAFGSLVAAGSPEIRATADRAEAARQNLLRELKAYQEATDDLAYQLRLCAR